MALEMEEKKTRYKVLLFDIGGVCVTSPFQAILDYEHTHAIPPGWINHSIAHSNPTGAWQRLERGEIPLDASFFTAFTTDLHNPDLWRTFHRTIAPTTPPPPLPSIAAEPLFWAIMSGARFPDPWMWPALQRLRRSGAYILGALSNTVAFPAGHAFAVQQDEMRRVFDVFVSSAHVGVRKPDARIYELALRELDAYAKREAGTERGREARWGEGVRTGEVLFLDDIGENLKAARRVGFGTLRVFLGRAYEAVDVLEEVTGLELAGDHPRIPTSLSKVPKAQL